MMTHVSTTDILFAQSLLRSMAKCRCGKCYARGTLGGISMLIINVSLPKLAERSISRCSGRDSDPMSREIRLHDAYDTRKLEVILFSCVLEKKKKKKLRGL